ncbi:MAG: hypothetical protein GY856_51765, partial [bacterium]|nr:hypothetical protein [bacterium]
ERAGAAWSRGAVLSADDGAADDEFGCAVSMDGDRVVVGAGSDDDNGVNSGAAYSFKRDGDSWIQWSKLIAENGGPYDHFGTAAAVSGDFILIGAWGFNGYGPSTGAAYLYPVTAAVLTASPAVISPGESVALTWRADAADDCVLEPDVGPAGVPGSATLWPDATTRWVLTCDGPHGAVSAHAQVVVANDAPEPTAAISASPDLVAPGGASVLSWSAEHADEIYIDPDVGPAGPVGSATVTPGESVYYRITARGPGGEATAMVKVAVNNLYEPVVSFRIDPESVDYPGSARLHWSVLFADDITIEPDIGPAGAEGSAEVAPFLTTTYTLTAENTVGATSVSRTLTVAWPPPGPVIDATPAAVAPGGVVTVTWSASHTLYAWIYQNDLPFLYFDQGPYSGTFTIHPTEDMDLKLVAAGPGGENTAGAAISMIHPTPEASIGVVPDEILLGESAQLCWNSSHADAVSIQPGIGSAALDGCHQVQPSETTLYTITALGPGGSATSDVLLTVIWPSPGITLASDPPVIYPGQTATLAWEVVFASEISMDQGVGPIAASGAVAVQPGETTVYTITALNPNAGFTQGVTVTVIPWPEPEAAISATPADLDPGETATLQWSAMYADDIVIEPGIGPVDPEGSVIVQPEFTTVYTLTARGPAGEAAAEVTVNVHHPEVVAALHVDPEVVEPGQEITLTWTTLEADQCVLSFAPGPAALNGSLTLVP